MVEGKEFEYNQPSTVAHIGWYPQSRVNTHSVIPDGRVRRCFDITWGWRADDEPTFSQTQLPKKQPRLLKRSIATLLSLTINPSAIKSSSWSSLFPLSTSLSHPLFPCPTPYIIPFSPPFAPSSHD